MWVSFVVLNEGGNQSRDNRGKLYYQEILLHQYNTDYKKYVEPKQKERAMEKQNIIHASKKSSTGTKIQCNGEEFDLKAITSEQTIQQLKRMAKNNLCLSFKQQKKFFELKDNAIKWVKSQQDKSTSLLYGPPGMNLFAVVLNDKYAFRHIFKNGGTTVNKVTKRGHIKADELGNRSLVAVVRDPIDHFLSGWAECGSRTSNPEEDQSFSPDVRPGKRAQYWLYKIQSCLSTKKKKLGADCTCIQHSFPQANFLLDPNGGQLIDPKIEMIGDLNEIHSFLKMVGLKYDSSTQPRARYASNDPVKANMFHWEKKKLSKTVIRRICEFVILDYYLFDFKPPGICRDLVASHLAMMTQNLK